MPYCTFCGAIFSGDNPACTRCGKSAETEQVQYKAAVALGSYARLSPRVRFRRLVAGAVDVSIAVVATLLLYRYVFVRMVLVSRLRTIGMLMVVLAFPTVYILLRDSARGKSIGKLMTGLTTVDGRTGVPIGVSGSLRRNACFALAVVPVVGWLLGGALATIAVVQIWRGRSHRIGEAAVGTAVVADGDAPLGVS